MTISTNTASASYTGNGATAIFPVPFYFLADTDLKITRMTAAGVVSVLTLNSQYTVSDAGNQAGGSITTIPALPLGDQIFIERNVSAVQETAYPANGSFPAASHERALDRLTMLAQQILSKLTFGLFRDPLGGTYDLGGGVLTNSGTATSDNDVPRLLQVRQVAEEVAAGVPGGVGTFVQAGTGAVNRTFQDKLRDVVNVRDFGAKFDGSTDDTAAIQAALDYVNSLGGGGVRMPRGIAIHGGLTLYSNTALRGAGRNATTLKLKTGANTDCLKSYQFDTLTGTASNGGTVNIELSDFCIDGNMDGNATGSGIKHYGWGHTFSNLSVKNVAEHGIWSEAGPGSNATAIGVEAQVDHVTVQKVGKVGYYFAGPHDSVHRNVIVFGVSISAPNTYDAFHFDGSASSRLVACHAFNAYNGGHKYSIYDHSGGLELIGGHFEGAKTANGYFNSDNSGKTIVSAETRFYAHTSAINVVINVPIVFRGTLLNAYNGADTVGIVMGDSAGVGPSNSIIHVNATGQTLGTIDFTNSKGTNSVHVRGYQATGPAYIGTPAQTDVVDINVDGATSATRMLFTGPNTNSLSASGTNQSTATQLPQRKFIDISSTPAGTGVRLPSSVMGLGPMMVANLGANAMQVYPPSGSQINTLGTNNALSVPSGKSAIFSCTRATQWLAVVGA